MIINVFPFFVVYTVEEDYNNRMITGADRPGRCSRIFVMGP